MHISSNKELLKHSVCSSLCQRHFVSSCYKHVLRHYKLSVHIKQIHLLFTLAENGEANC